MKRTKLFRFAAMLAILATFLVVITASGQTNILEPVFMFPEDILRVACLDNGVLDVQLIGTDKAQVFCNFGEEEPTPTVTPVETEPPLPTPTATESPLPTPTATEPPLPTPTVTTPPPTPTEPPVGDVPFCDHDPRAFHTLIERNTTGEIICHYNHEHGDDPHVLDDLFGTEVYDIMGGEIAYPWQTPNENLYKHGGYAWYVRTNLIQEIGDAREGYGCTPYSPGCFRNVRALAHGVGEVRGNVVGFHSFYMEAEICYDGNCGIVRIGGWQGPATLFVDEFAVLPRENDNQRVFLSYYNTGNRCCSTWYNGLDSQMAGVVVEFGDMWNTIPLPPDLSWTNQEKAAWMIDNSEWRCPTNADGSVDFANCRENSSYRQLHIVTFGIPQRYVRAGVFTPVDGILNESGYMDRYGEVNPACTEIGLDCVPFSFENVPHTQYQYRSYYVEYDIPRNGNPYSGWIEPQIQLPAE